MNPLIQLKMTTLALLVQLVFVCVALCPMAHAVVPAPDGGYPGGNTAEGQNALLSRTTGIYNTGIGIYSLLSLTEGSFCTGVGAGTLLVNAADRNTATGAGALLSNTTGGNNTANGTFALFSNTEGTNNTANGDSALLSNTTGNLNTANGVQALFSNTTGNNNAANGEEALLNNTTGNNNTANGAFALSSNTTGFNNTADGLSALLGNTTGSGNVALGIFAGANLTTGNNNIDIGALGLPEESNTIRIGEQGTQATTFIAGISGTAVVGDPVVVDVNGQLGTIASLARFKEDIRPLDKASEALLALKPVTFRYKKQIDRTGRSQFGLVAEDVERVNPDLVVRDKEGKPYSVRYDQVNAMLLNEFLKEHRTVEELKKQIEALTAGLQKVSAQLEVSKPEPQTALNHQ